MALRTFAASDGTTWTAWLVQSGFAATVPGTPTEWLAFQNEANTERRTRLLPRPELANGWLLFTSGEERRRFDALPPGWTLASDALLCRWCEDASPVLPCAPRRRSSSPEQSQ